MAGVEVYLSANTVAYLNQIDAARKKSNSSFDAIGKKANQLGNDVSSAFNSPGTAITGFLNRLGPAGLAIGGVTAAVGGASAALVMMGSSVASTQKQLEKLAAQNNTTVAEISKIAVVANQAGIDLGKLSDQLKDVADKQGDYLSTGGGAFADYFDTIKGKIDRTADDLRGLSSLALLRTVQNDLDTVGASTAQQTFVLESLASDASKLTPLLRMSENELDNMLKGYSTNRAILSQETVQDINRIQSNMDMLQNNFNAAMTESFNGLIKLADRMTKAASDALYNISESAKRQSIIGSYTTGNLKVNSSNAQEFLDSAQDIQGQTRIDARARATKEVQGLPFGDEYWKKVDELTKKYIDEANTRLSNDVIKAADIQNAARINNQGSGTAGNAPALSIGTREDATKQLQDLNAQRTNILKEQGRLETQLQNAIGEETKKALEGQIENQKSLLETNSSNVKTVTEKLGTYSRESAQKRIAAQAALSKTEQDSARQAHNVLLAQLNTYLQEGSLTRDEYNQAVLIAEQKLSDKLVEIKDKELKKKQELEQKAFNDAQNLLNQKLYFSTVSKQQADLELEIAVNKAQREFDIANQGKDNAVITEQQKQDKISELRREHNDKMIDEDLADVQNEEIRNQLKIERQIEFLNEQHQLGLVSEESYNAARIEQERSYTEAKPALVTSQLDMMSNLFSGMSQNLKDGSKAQRAAFLLEKAATISRLTLSSFDAWGAVDKDPSLITMPQKVAAKVAIGAQYAAQLAAAGSTVLGQFHDGTPEGGVPQTGSYILQQGERVISRSGNDDLSSYLESNKTNSAPTVINADLVINGGAGGISDERFQALMIEHRDIVSTAVKMSQQERGQ